MGGTILELYGVVAGDFNRKEENGSDPNPDTTLPWGVDSEEVLREGDWDFKVPGSTLLVCVAPEDLGRDPPVDPAEVATTLSRSPPSSENKGMGPYFFSIDPCNVSNSPLTSWYLWYRGRIT